MERQSIQYFAETETETNNSPDLVEPSEVTSRESRLQRAWSSKLGRIGVATVVSLGITYAGDHVPTAPEGIGPEPAEAIIKNGRSDARAGNFSPIDRSVVRTFRTPHKNAASLQKAFLDDYYKGCFYSVSPWQALEYTKRKNPAFRKLVELEDTMELIKKRPELEKGYMKVRTLRCPLPRPGIPITSYKVKDFSKESDKIRESTGCTYTDGSNGDTDGKYWWSMLVRKLNPNELGGPKGITITIPILDWVGLNELHERAESKQTPTQLVDSSKLKSSHLSIKFSNYTNLKVPYCKPIKLVDMHDKGVRIYDSINLQ